MNTAKAAFREDHDPFRLSQPTSFYTPLLFSDTVFVNYVLLCPLILYFVITQQQLLYTPKTITIIRNYIHDKMKSRLIRWFIQDEVDEECRTYGKTLKGSYDLGNWADNRTFLSSFENLAVNMRIKLRLLYDANRAGQSGNYGSIAGEGWDIALRQFFQFDNDAQPSSRPVGSNR